MKPATIQEKLNSKKIWVLRRRGHKQPDIEYYTGKYPTTSIVKARFFREDQIKAVMKFAHTGFTYDPVIASGKELFLAILKGK